MDDKRMFRHAISEDDREKYREFKNDITKECRLENEKWWNAQCEKLSKINQIGLLHKPIKTLSGLTKHPIKRILRKRSRRMTRNKYGANM